MCYHAAQGQLIASHPFCRRAKFQPVNPQHHNHDPKRHRHPIFLSTPSDRFACQAIVERRATAPSPEVRLPKLTKKKKRVRTITGTGKTSTIRSESAICRHLSSRSSLPSGAISTSTRSPATQPGLLRGQHCQGSGGAWAKGSGIHRSRPCTQWTALGVFRLSEWLAAGRSISRYAAKSAAWIHLWICT